MEADLGVAWTLCKHVSSNAVVLVKDRVLVGMGAGQPNRVGSAKIAVDQAKHRTDGAVCATDAFLPFPDTLVVVADAGCVALAHTGGSIRDEDSIVAANERGIVLVTTGYRHFRH
jgi:phosphoribosylaminoimidazolecarboxamide formyltransferase/IMP cyclohydrolase